MTEKERRRAYLRALFGRQRLAASAFSAGLGQVMEEPHEWPQDPKGYGERYADSMARNAISETVGFGIAKTLHEDPRYHPLLSGTILARAWWALRWTAMIHTEDGGAQPNLPVFVGAYSSEFIANSWYPASISDPQNALRRGSYALVGEYAFNLWSEFGRGWLAGHRRHKTRVPPPVHK